MPPASSESKQRVRARIKRRFRDLPPADAARMSAEVALRLEALPEYAAARSVLFYFARPDEVDTRSLIEAAVRRDVRVALPVCMGRDAAEGAPPPVGAFRLDVPLDDLKPDAYRILAPDPDRAPPVEPAEIDLIVVPGRAFDPHGGRLGRGVGHYDAFLGGLRTAGWSGMAVGLAYGFQVVDRVPVDRTDQEMDIIVTEERVIRCSSAREGP